MLAFNKYLYYGRILSKLSSSGYTPTSWIAESYGNSNFLRSHLTAFHTLLCLLPRALPPQPPITIPVQPHYLSLHNSRSLQTHLLFPFIQHRTASFVCVYAKLLQSHPTLCNPMHCSTPGSSVHGILQARMLEWVSMPSSRRSSQPRDRPHGS